MRRGLDPFRAVPLLDVEEKIESLLCTGDTLFVGTNMGSVIQIALGAASSATEDLVASARRVGAAKLPQRRPVEHLAASGGFVLAISDGVCSALTAADIASTAPVALGKEARCVCAHTGQPPPDTDDAGAGGGETAASGGAGAAAEFCISFKKKLVLYRHNGRSFEQRQEFPTSDAASTLVWHQSWICAGFRKEYSLYSDKAGVPREICGLDGRTTPRIALVFEGELLLMIQESVGLFFNLSTQQPSSKSTVTWPRKVAALGTTSNYVFGSASPSQVDIFGARDQKLCQTLAIDGAVVSICGSSGGRAFVASEASVTCLDPVPFDRQIKKLLLQSRIGDALDLLNATFGPGDPQREEQLSRLHTMAGWSLFSDLQFMQGFMHFMYSRDFRVAGLLLFWRKHLPPGWDASIAGGAPSPSDGAPEPCSIEDFVRGRLQAKQDVASDAAVSANVGLANGAIVFLLLKQREALQAQARLPASERPAGAPEPEHLLRAADTVLLRLLVETDEDDLRLQQLLNSGVRCAVEDAEEFLRQRNRRDVLARLWKAHRRYDMVLREWDSMLGDSAGANDHLAGAGVRASPPQKVVASEMALALKAAASTSSGAELLRLYVPRLLAADPRAALPIFVSDVGAAGAAGAGASAAAAAGAGVALGHGRLPLPPDEVLDLLSPHGELLKTYLEHLAISRREAEPRHCLQLANIYLAEVAEEQRCGETSATLGPTRQKLLHFLEDAEPLDVAAVLPRVEALGLHQERVVLCCREQRHKEALQVLVEKLNDLPRAEVYCRIVMARRHAAQGDAGFDGDDLRRTPGASSSSSSAAAASGGAKRPLSIFSAEIPPWARGVVFTAAAMAGARGAGAGGCSAPTPAPPAAGSLVGGGAGARAWEGSETGAPRPLMLLVEVLLDCARAAEESPESFRKVAAEYKEAVIALLTGYAGHSDLAPHEVVGMLPESWPLHGLAPYLAKCARMCLHQRRASMLEESLSSMAYLKTFSAWAQERMRKVTITNERACPTCNRRFVDKDAVSKAFVAYPNGTCVHLQCKEDLSVCPKTGRSFADNLSVYCHALGGASPGAGAGAGAGGGEGPSGAGL